MKNKAADVRPKLLRTRRSPDRSMGFVSVIVVSLLFAVGLPMVLPYRGLLANC